MARSRPYRISLDPASRAPGWYSVSFSLLGRSGLIERVEASSLDELAAHIDRIVAAAGPAPEQAGKDGVPCWHVAVRILDGGRKPNGFDKFCDAHRYTEPAV